MFSVQLDPIQWLMIAAVFGLVLSLWLIGVTVWTMMKARAQNRMRRRLGLEPTGRRPVRELFLWIDGRMASTAVPGSRRLPWFERLRQLHEAAGWEGDLNSFVLMIAGILSCAFLAAFVLSQSVLVSLLAAACAGALLGYYINMRIGKRAALFERQFLDALGMAARSLRVGHPLTGAFQMIAKEMSPPVSRIFAEICQQQELGIGLDEAIARTVNRHSNADLHLFATAVIIQLRSGGNLAEMMDRLNQVIRERLRLAQRARVLTAQAQFSKRVLLVLPFLIYLLLSLINPNYENRLLSTETGRLMLGGAGLSMLIGAWFMQRLAVLKY